MNQSETLLPKHLEDSLGIALKNSKSLSNINQGFPGLLEHHTNENVKAFPFHRYIITIKKNEMLVYIKI